MINKKFVAFDPFETKENVCTYFSQISLIWREYDTDNSGYIEADELKNFLRDLLKEAKKINDVSEDKLIEYTDTMLQVFDANKDGRLQLSEMAKLLPVKENFLCRQVFKKNVSILEHRNTE
ncbi:calbindin-32-like [Teleopsis dalmanni]|uniref:calbindin-32-like n=1 Tax=Teleopsis dalmanni TaxID=139649 RepID=UPI0018CE9F75|nr:calbindin-32-like [Teleopsis dalmanni]